MSVRFGRFAADTLLRHASDMWLKDVVAEVRNAVADVEGPLLTCVPWRREAGPAAPLSAATKDDSNVHAISSASNDDFRACWIRQCQGPLL